MAGSASVRGARVSEPLRPLADRMRPQSIDEFAGQRHLLAPGRALRVALERGQLHSMILWGPPGTGKTTLARLFARVVDAEFLALSAVMAGVKDIRAAVEEARRFREQGRATVLFLDEVHRFNKAQQDAFLPYVEDGTLIFIGATTENPSFALNNALLSRARVCVLAPLSDAELLVILRNALEDPERGLGASGIRASDAELLQLAQGADGDARRALNLLELAADLAVAQAAEGATATLTPEILAAVLAGSYRRFDRQGDQFYEQISALHKAVRGSRSRCLALLAGTHARRRLRSGLCGAAHRAHGREDIGNADPRGLTLALEAWEAYERLGSPEGELALAQAWCFSPVRPRAMPFTPPGRRRGPMCARMAAWKCRWRCAMRRPH
jgi:putative ATPase